jgi:hypothetical protein
VAAAPVILAAEPSVATFLDVVAAALRAAGAFNRDDQTRPAAVLWPDRDRQWSTLLPRLRALHPILTLGELDAETRSGPAYWLRYALLHEVPAEDGLVPVVYLPGVSRTDLRAVEECPRPLRPIAELQYRGTFWSHRNGRDWTVAAFLGSADAGVGLEVAADAATKDALLQSLTVLADLPLSRLRRFTPLRAEFFHGLLTPDEARSLLEWLDEPETFRQTATPEAWRSFRALLRQHYGFDPERDGPLTGAEKLGGREGRWANVWNRFREAPAKYPHLPELLRRARPADKAQLDLFGDGAWSETWPQDNEAAESALRDGLSALASVGPVETRKIIAQLDAEHGPRRQWVWAELGRSPLAAALGHLAALAEFTERVPGGATLTDVATAYATWGWQADAAMLGALGAVELAADVGAVGAAIRAVYRPWLADAATAYQSAAKVGVSEMPPLTVDPGTCIVFADGLRYDVAHSLADLVRRPGQTAELSWRFGALPGVTPTAKPAVSPVADRVGPWTGFDTAASGSSTKLTAEGLRKLLADAGWEVLAGGETGDPSGRAWTESGAIDQSGHGHGWKLAHYLPGEVRTIAHRIADLLAAGWRRVVVVTDHGWLLLPGGLPKSELPEHLTELRKGRCAGLKPNAATDELILPWHWDGSVRIAVARGIACYEAGKEYEHGGLSPQECVIPVMTVTTSQSAVPIAISGVLWRGLRCEVRVENGSPEVMVDIRTKAGDAASSIVLAPKPVTCNGSASLVVEDEDREGEAAHVVLLDSAGRLLAQQVTTVGG